MRYSRLIELAKELDIADDDLQSSSKARSEIDFKSDPEEAERRWIKSCEASQKELNARWKFVRELKRLGFL